MTTSDPAAIPEAATRTPRAQVRDRILAAAEREFLERGYRAASLAGIARRAGFTKGAVYSNFSSKQTLLVQMLSERSARLSRGALDRLSGSDAAVADPGDGDPEASEGAARDAGGTRGVVPVNTGAHTGARTGAQGRARGIDMLAHQAADLLARELLASQEANLLLTELALHAASDPDAARSYAELRTAQRDSLARELGVHLVDLDLRADADVDGAAFLLVTIMSALAVERAADPESVDRERISSALQTVLSALLAQSARPQGP